MLGSLLYTLLMISIGIFIGWQIPQPMWANRLYKWMKRKVQEIFDKD